MIIYKKRIRFHQQAKTWSAKWLHFNNESIPKLHNVILKRHARATEEHKLVKHVTQHAQALGLAQQFPQPIASLCNSNQFAYHKMAAIPLYIAYKQLLQKDIQYRLALFRELLLVIQTLHQPPIQLIHNDLSPGNILLGDNQKILIIDFAEAQPSTSNTTQQFVTKGKPHYTSPEQTKGLKTTVSSDIFQLGCILFDLLFAQQFLDINDCAQYTFEKLPPLHQPQQQLSLETTQWLCSKMLAPEPSYRFQSINECVIGIDSLMNSAVI